MKFLLFLLIGCLNNVFAPDIGLYKIPRFPLNFTFLLCKDCNNFSCKGYKRCYQNPISTCYAQWKTEDDRNIEIQNAGCYVGDFFCDDHCKTNEAYNVKSNSKLPNEIASSNMTRGFCCCQKDKCNRIIIPSQDDPKNQPVTFLTSKKFKLLSGITIAISICLLIIFIIIVYFLRFRKLKSDFEKKMEYFPFDSQSPIPGNETFGTFNEIKVDEIFLIQLIDSQWCSKLYRCYYNESEISLKLVATTLDELNYLMLTNWKTINHKNIVTLMNVVNLEEDRTAYNQIIEQTMLGATYHHQMNLAFILSCRIEDILTNYLRDSPVDLDKCVCILMDILAGIKFLHARYDSTCKWKDQIVHTNLKTSSILLKSDGNFCISDLEAGVCFRDNQDWSFKELRSVDISMYTAPEILNGCITRSADALLAIDVYSFSLIMWELMNRCSEISDSAYKEAFLIEGRQFDLREHLREKICENGERPKIPDFWLINPSIIELIDTMKECWEKEYYLRPSIINLSGRMKRIKDKSS